MAEVLAHHYSQTDHTNKAFVYLSMAGARSLGVYSLDEAANYFTAALALLDNNPDCASDDQVSRVPCVVRASVEFSLIDLRCLLTWWGVIWHALIVGMISKPLGVRILLLRGTYNQRSLS